MKKLIFGIVSFTNLGLMVFFVFACMSERVENNRLVLENQKVNRLLEDYQNKLKSFKDEIITTVEKRFDIDPSYGKSIKENGVYCGHIEKIVNVKNDHEYFFRVPLMYKVDEDTVRQVGFIDLKEQDKEYIVRRTSYMGVANADEIEDFNKEARERRIDTLEMSPVDVYRKAIEFFPDYFPMNLYLAYDGVESKVAWFVIANSKTESIKLMVTPKFVYKVKE